jgi:DNA-directed RNA polymerase specialized sigma24 family protein
MTEQRMRPALWEKANTGSDDTSVATNGFPMTDWGLVLSAGAESRPALERLCREYWGPAYALVRRVGYGRDAALDLIQEFFAEIFEEKAFSRVKAGSGPFRVWLLTALEEFLVRHMEGDRRAAASQGVPLEVARTDEADAIDRMADGALEPRREYERVLALSLLERALARLERAQAERGQSERFLAFKRWLVVAPSQDELSSIARALGLTPTSARMAHHALRQHLGSFVQEELSNLLERRDDTEGLRSEMDALLGALAS